MFKQVIVANKKLDMSPGKISAMASHGAVSFLTEWLRRNVIPAPDSRDYAIKPEARIDGDLYPYRDGIPYYFEFIGNYQNGTNG